MTAVAFDLCVIASASPRCAVTLNLQLCSDLSCRRRPVSRERNQPGWNLDPDLRRDDRVLHRFVTAQRGNAVSLRAVTG